MIAHFAPYLVAAIALAINIRTRGRQLTKAAKRISQSNSFTLTALSQMQELKQVKPQPRWEYSSQNGPDGQPKIVAMPVKSDSEYVAGG
jgi:hypothetical protein